jgi:hypothetical protein
LLGNDRTLGRTDELSNSKAKRKLAEVVRLLKHFQKAADKKSRVEQPLSRLRFLIKYVATPRKFRDYTSY